MQSHASRIGSTTAVGIILIVCLLYAVCSLSGVSIDSLLTKSTIETINKPLFAVGITATTALCGYLVGQLILAASFFLMPGRKWVYEKYLEKVKQETVDYAKDVMGMESMSGHEIHRFIYYEMAHLNPDQIIQVEKYYTEPVYFLRVTGTTLIFSGVLLFISLFGDVTRFVVISAIILLVSGIITYLGYLAMLREELRSLMDRYIVEKHHED